MRLPISDPPHIHPISVPLIDERLTNPLGQAKQGRPSGSGLVEPMCSPLSGLDIKSKFEPKPKFSSLGSSPNSTEMIKSNNR